MLQLTTEEITDFIEKYKNNLENTEVNNLKIIQNKSSIEENFEEINMILNAFKIYEIEEKYKRQILSATQIYDQSLNVYTLSCVRSFIEHLNSYFKYTYEVFDIDSYCMDEREKVINKLEKIDIRVLNHIFNISCTLKRDDLNENLYMIGEHLGF